MEATLMVQQAVHGQLLIPISHGTVVAIDAVQTVLLAAEITPYAMVPMESDFRDVILAACFHLETMDTATLHRLAQLAAVKRPTKLWDIVDQMIQADNDRNSRTGRWSPSSN